MFWTVSLIHTPILTRGAFILKRSCRRIPFLLFPYFAMISYLQYDSLESSFRCLIRVKVMRATKASWQDAVMQRCCLGT